jgi:hypothetical protein
LVRKGSVLPLIAASIRLDELAGLIDWTPVDRSLGVFLCSAKGEPDWPPVALFKAVLRVFGFRADAGANSFLTVSQDPYCSGLDKICSTRSSTPRNLCHV